FDLFSLLVRPPPCSTLFPYTDALPISVTLTNTAAAGGSSVAVNSVGVSGAGLIWAFTKGTDNCTGANLAPGATCTVGVTFSRFLSVGTHTGAITFTDTATGSPQSGVLTGVAQ